MYNVIIKDQIISNEAMPYFIAEMSGNHNQSFDQAISIIDAAKRVGANALKLQTYTADTLTIKSRKKDFFVDDKDSLWNGNTLYELYEKAYTDWDWIAEIIEYSQKIGLDCFSSVFDETSVDFMENLNTVAYKIASFENGHIPLIRKVASTKKPLIISTGMASENEVDEAVENAYEAGCKQLILLKCISSYPSNPKDYNMLTIPYMMEKYKCLVGLSDHSLGIGVAIASVAIGASVVEKHFITSRDNHGVDSAFSADEYEFEMLINEAKKAKSSLGKIDFSISQSEKNSIKFRRSIYAVNNIKEGEAFNKENIKIIRPGYGLHPRFFYYTIGKIADKNYMVGDRLSLKSIGKK